MVVIPDEPRYLPGTQIEIINDKIECGKFKYGLFDFDGTISIVREGWQKIMGPVMIEMICGDHEPTQEIIEEVEDYIDDSTGIQTILQMEHLVEMVKTHGFVPEDQILDARGYKKIYNDRLMVPVRERLGKLAKGEKSIEDLTLRGAIGVLRKLSDHGLTMYAASGTDRADVRNESTALGAARYFNGGVFGALGSIEEYSKDKVIKEIISKYNLHGSELFIVGDGPVEIRNAKDNGAVAIGVASDEVRGYGLNSNKRIRLIKAGSDIIIPDFGEGDKLYEYLFPKG